LTARQTPAPSLPAQSGQGLAWLQALARAVRDQGRRALNREVPFALVLDDVARAVWDQLLGMVAEETLRGWLQETAQVSTADLRREAERLSATVASELPSIQRTQLAAYLAQASASLRQYLRRPADSAGQRVPMDLPLRGPEDLLPLLPPRPALYRPGDRPDGLEQWRLEELLALGEVSEVWQARPARSEGAPVVLKFWPEKLARTDVFYQDTTRLIDLLQDESLAGIVKLKEVSPDRDPVCLRYELVDGGGLTGLVQKWARSERSPSLVEQAARLMLGLAQVVAQAHNREGPLVHGNLKLAHLILQPVPNGPLVLRVTDYGLGRAAVRREVSASALPPGLVRLLGQRGALGKLTASPQVLRGAVPGPADDVWSVGAIAYQMLLADPSAVIDSNWRDRLTERQVPRPLLHIVRECLKEQPERRITARALVEELNQALSPKVLAVVTGSSVEKGPQDPQAERTRQVRERIDRLHERARQLAGKYDYTGAADLLEAVPERLRDAALFEEVCRKRDRARQLDREITAALREGKHEGLRDQVQELLKLKPMRTELRELLNELPKE
jgi:serine/threonine protein kinase